MPAARRMRRIMMMDLFKCLVGGGGREASQGCGSRHPWMLARDAKEIPVKVACRLFDRGAVVRRASAIHPATVVVITVVPVFVPVQHVVWIEGLVGVKGMPDVGWNRQRGDIHLRVGSVAKTLGVIVVEQVGLPVRPAPAVTDKGTLIDDSAVDDFTVANFAIGHDFAV